MTKRAKTPIDLNKLATFITDQATSESVQQRKKSHKKTKPPLSLGGLVV